MNSYSILDTKFDKTVRYRTPQGKEVCVTREVYVRPEACCGLSQCNDDYCKSVSRKKLPASKILVLLDANILMNFWEVFEIEEVKGVVLTYSSLCYIQQCSVGKRHYNRIKKALDDPVQDATLFDNEFCSHCYDSQKPYESFVDYTSRLNWNAARWYSEHLPSLEIVFITDNVDAIQNGKSTKTDINVMSVSGYLEAFHPKLETAHRLCESLEASIAQEKTEQKPPTTPMAMETAPGDVYPSHLSDAALAAGLRANQFLKGILRVSRFRSSQEATVVLTDASTVKHLADFAEDATLSNLSEIMVHGMQNRNRAVDGDVVIVRLLPRAQWARASNDLTAEESGAAETAALGEPAAENEAQALSGRSLAVSSNLPCGVVVGVSSRNWRDYVCSFDASPDCETGRLNPTASWVLVTPWDRRIPRIRISTSHAQELSKERFIVRIDRWEANSNYPCGHFVRSLGHVGDLETETQTIVHEYGLGVRPFGDCVLKELEPLAERRPWAADPKEVLKRRDLRSPLLAGARPDAEDLLVFSIDPPGCEDVDDTLSVRRLPTGRLQLGVHIADVTHFVQPGSFVDLEARRRCTSVYMADRRYDMLPGILSGDICSLWSGRDRYAVSVLWELDPESLEVLDVWYGRTVIRSRYKMAYETAQRIHDLDASSGAKIVESLGGAAAVRELIPELGGMKRDVELQGVLAELRDAIHLLVSVASGIRHKRMLSGGLELDSIEVSVRFENPETRSGKLEDLVPKQPMEMHGTVAELMIFANHWVARRCLQTFPDRSCLRRHPAPKPEHFEELRVSAQSKNFQIDVHSNRALAESLDRAKDPADDQVNVILRQLATRAMTNALYFCTGAEGLTREDFAHYGLALNLYTHFTSPIRRYADVLVHRLLLAALALEDAMEVGEVKPTAAQQLLTPSDLVAVCRTMNELHWAAQQAQRCSVELFQAMFFRQLPVDSPTRFVEGIICQLRGSNGFSVLATRYGIRGNVCVKTNDGRVAWIEEDDGKQKKTKKRTKEAEGPRSSVVWKEASGGLVVERVRSEEDAGGCGFLEVRQGDQRQRYRLFDHVLVYVEVKDSFAHGLALKLTLAGRCSAPTAGEGGEAAKSSGQLDEALLQQVRKADSDRQRKRRMGCDAKEGEEEEEEEDSDQDEMARQAERISSLHDPTSTFWKLRRLLAD